MSPEAVSKATFIAFYSFKGGVGRSMALINTAAILAGRRGFRVLVLDLDLEAPGLSYLDPESPDTTSDEVQREVPLQAGFVDLLTDAKERGETADLFLLPDADLEAKYTRDIKLPEPLREFPGGSLRIMPSGRRGRDYSQRLEALNLNALYQEGLGEPLIRAFKKRLAESDRYDYVLVDSRTGISEGAGICTRDLADHVMVLSGLNRQNVEGTSDFLREFRAATGGSKAVQVILSPIPNGEDDLLERRRKVAELRFGEALGTPVDLSLEVPYHPQLALTEEPHIFRRRRGHLFEAYLRIEKRMLTGLGHDAPSFVPRILRSLDGGRYMETLRQLHHLIRLDHGKALLRMVMQFVLKEGTPVASVGRKANREPVFLERLLADGASRSVIQFLVDHISLREWELLLMPLLDALDQADPQMAEGLVQRLLEAAGKRASTLAIHGRRFVQQGKFERAEPFLRRAVEASPEDAGIIADHAVSLFRLGRMQDAEVQFRRAVEASPEDATILVCFADFLAHQGRFQEADPFYRRTVQGAPEDVAILEHYAQFLERHGLPEEAVTFRKRAAEADPENRSMPNIEDKFLISFDAQ